MKRYIFEVKTKKLALHHKKKMYYFVINKVKITFCWVFLVETCCEPMCEGTYLIVEVTQSFDRKIYKMKGSKTI